MNITREQVRKIQTTMAELETEARAATDIGDPGLASSLEISAARLRAALNARSSSTAYLDAILDEPDSHEDAELATAEWLRGLEDALTHLPLQTEKPQ